MALLLDQMSRVQGVKGKIPNHYKGYIRASLYPLQKNTLLLKVVYPIVFVLNIFPNSRLIQKRIHIWQLF